MFIGTHACIPLLTVGTIDIIRLKSDKPPLVNNTQLILIGVAGILPDMLWPHTSMQARLTSWTHTFWFLLISFPIILIASKFYFKKSYLTFMLLFWAAMALHIFTDAISGGVSFTYPIEKVYGARWIPWPTWIWYDISAILITVIVFIARYRILKSKMAT